MMSLFKLYRNRGNSVRLANRMSARLVLLTAVLLMQACATSKELTTARGQFKQGNAEVALKTLDKADVSRRDELLLLLDKGSVAQATGQYELSIKAFEEAYQLIERLDYVSLGDQSAATFTNDWVTRYRGEISERLWIHTFQMINFLMMDAPTSAAVEARRAVALYEGQDDVLDNDLFTRYLMALSFEAAGQYDSASVEYRKLAAIEGADEAWQASNSEKELVLMVASGFIAPKIAGELYIDINARISFPFYAQSYERAPAIDVVADSVALTPLRVDTQLVPIARSALAKRGKAIAARQALRLAAKYAVTEELSRQDPVAGSVAKLFLMVIEQADTRSWETLPAYLSLVRVKIPDDVLSVNVNIDSSGSTSSVYRTSNLQLDVGDEKKQFHLIRVGIENSAQLLASP